MESLIFQDGDLVLVKALNFKKDRDIYKNSVVPEMEDSVGVVRKVKKHNVYGVHFYDVPGINDEGIGYDPRGLELVDLPYEFVCTTDALQDLKKDTNPKDAVGVRKWRQFTTVPMTVLSELGVAMLEGGMKYGRHNYRVAGVKTSVYIDAAIGHIVQFWEGEDIDPDSGISHVTKAIASLTVLRDAMIQDKLNDDRPPKANLDKLREELGDVVNGLFERYGENPAAPFTETGE